MRLPSAPAKIREREKLQQALFEVNAAQIPEDAEGGDQRYADEKGHAQCAVGEDAEGRPLVAHVGEVEEARDHRERLPLKEVAVDVELGSLVEDQDDSGDAQQRR